jgi:RNA polymerase sigma-70 factor (ECF subfamily)
MGMSNQPGQGEARSAEDERVDALVRRAQEGSMDAVDELVRTYQTPMFNLAYRMVNQREDAYDLTQEIFVKVCRSIRSFRWNSRFSTWLHSLAINTCRSRRQRLRRIGFFEAVSLDVPKDEGGGSPACYEPVDARPRPDDDLERHETQEIVSRAIAAIPEEFREVLVLRDIQGLSYEDIAVATGCQVGTVKSRLWRARARVRDELLREGVICGASK